MQPSHALWLNLRSFSVAGATVSHHATRSSLHLGQHHVVPLVWFDVLDDPAHDRIMPFGQGSRVSPRRLSGSSREVRPAGCVSHSCHTVVVVLESLHGPNGTRSALAVAGRRRWAARSCALFFSRVALLLNEHVLWHPCLKMW
jgi:hypothetical protein